MRGRSSRARSTAFVVGSAVLALATGCNSSGSTTASSSSAPSGSSGASAGTKASKLAYIVKYGSVPYFIQENKGVQSKSSKLGLTTTTTNVETDVNAALSAVDTSIGAGAQGLMIVVPDQKIGPAVMDKAKAAHVPVISIDDPIKDSAGKDVPFVGFDAEALGTQVGKTLVKELGAAGVKAGSSLKIASIEDQKTPVCMTRNQAAEKALLAGFPGLSQNNIVHVPYNNDLNSAITAMGPVYTANPSVKTWVIYSCNDGGVLGAARALQNSGVSPDSIYGVGIGGEYACQEWGKGKPSGFRASLYTNSAIHGSTAVQELYDFITKGTPIPMRTILPGIPVDPTNYKTSITC